MWPQLRPCSTASSITGMCSSAVLGVGGPRQQRPPQEARNEDAAGRSPQPKPNRKKAFFIGDAVPKPLGFTALPPEWLSVGAAGAAPPTVTCLLHSGRWVGAP